MLKSDRAKWVAVIVTSLAWLTMCAAVLNAGFDDKSARMPSSASVNSAPRVPTETKSEDFSERADPVYQGKALELGEGSAQGTATLWPVDGGAPIEVPFGTRIEKLVESPLHRRPHGVPPNYAVIRARILTGPHAGSVFYVRSFQFQATGAVL